MSSTQKAGPSISAIATAPPAEWRKFTLVCLSLGPMSAALFVAKLIDILTTCAMSPRALDVATGAALLFAFVFFEATYISARRERQFTPESDRRPPTPRRQKPAKKATRPPTSAPRHDDTPAPGPAPKRRDTFTPAIAPEERLGAAPTTAPDDKKKAGRRFGFRLPTSRKGAKTIKIKVGEGADELTALAQEAARRGWEAIRDTATGDLALYDPKKRRVYAAQFTQGRGKK